MKTNQRTLQILFPGQTSVLPNAVGRITPPVSYHQVAKQSYWITGRSFQNSVSMILMDTLALCFSLAGGGAVRYLLLGQTALPLWVWMLIPAWWFGAGATGLLPGWGLSAVDHLKRLVILLSALFCVGMVGIFFAHTGDTVSRLSVAATWVLAIVLVPLFRTTTRQILCSRGEYGVPTIIFGRAKGIADAAARLTEDPGVGYFPVGACTNDSPGAIDSLPLRGGLLDVPHAPAAVVVTEGLGANEVNEVIENALASYRNVMILPNLGDIPSLLARPRDVGGLIGLEVYQTLYNPFATKVKRIIDLVLVWLTLPFWLPLCSFLVVLIWVEDRNPPIYKQERSGRNGKPFFAYKCRTMVVNAEKVLAVKLESDPTLKTEWETNFKLRKDPRITRVGSFLRRSSLDELPQLVNVLLGQMALVGPRPLPSYHLKQMGLATQKVRARVRPGITGLWQVSGRSDIGNEGMARWDGYYVKNWSIWLDIVIIVRTVRAVVLGSGAR